MKNEIIIIDPKEFGLEEKSAKSIEAAFAPKIIERDGLRVVYEQVIKKELTKETCKEAGDLRRKLVKVRTGISDIHKTQKAYFLASGRFVDAWKNKETKPVEQMEETLTEIEKHFEIQEAKIKKELQNQRVEQLSKYAEDAHERQLSDMDEDVWNAYINAKKKQYEDMIAAEKKAEQERIAKEKAEEEERKRIRIENERLKKEAEERERLAKIESDKRVKADKERLIKEEADRKKREKEQREIREQHEAQLKKEREEKERIQAEIRAKGEAEAARIAKEKQGAEIALKVKEEAKQAELNKGDAEKVNDLISDLRGLKTKYSFKSTKNSNMYNDVKILIDKVIDHIA